MYILRISKNARHYLDNSAFNKKKCTSTRKGGYKVAKGHLKAIDIGAEAIYTLIVSQM